MNLKRKVITSAILLTVLAGAPVAGKFINQTNNLIDQSIQNIKSSKLQEPDTYATVITDPESAGISISITDPYDAATNEIGIQWDINLTLLNQAINSSWTTGTQPEVSFLRIMFVNQAEFAKCYPDGFSLNPNNLDPWNDTLYPGYDENDPSTIGRWGVDIGLGGLINDWMTEYDTDGDGNGIDDIPTTYAADKGNAPVMQIRNGSQYDPDTGEFTEQSAEQFAKGSISPIGENSLAHGTATVRNLRPGLTYDGIIVMGTTRDTSADDLIDDSVDGGFAGSVFTGGGGNFETSTPIDIAGGESIVVPPSSTAKPTITTLTPEGEDSWIQFNTPTTTDGATGTVDATINYSVMEDAEAGNFNNSKTNITGITLTSDKDDTFILTEADFDDTIDTSVIDGYVNPYTGETIEGELPDPAAVATATDHSYTITGLEAGQEYTFTATVDYEANVNALTSVEYTGDSDAGMFVYNDIGGGETTPVNESEDLTFSFTTPDLGTSLAPVITPSTPELGTVEQTDINLEFDIDSTFLGAETYNPVVTKVEITSEDIIGGSLDVTDKGDASGHYSVTLDSTNSTFEANQVVDDLMINVTYNELPSNTPAAAPATATFDTITMADKDAASIDAVTTTATATSTTVDVEYSFDVKEESVEQYGTTPTAIELLDETDNVVGTVETIPTPVDGTITGTVSATGLTSSTDYSNWKVQVTYDAETTGKTVTSSPIGFTTGDKEVLAAPTITNVDVTAGSDSATVTLTGTGFAAVEETETSAGKTEVAVSTDIPGATVSSDVTITDTEITFTVLGLGANQTYSGNVILSYSDIINGSEVPATSVTETLEITTIADTTLSVQPTATLVSNESNKAEISVTFNGLSANSATSKVEGSTLSYGGEELTTTYISQDDTSGNVVATYEVSNLNEVTTYETTGWSFDIPMQTGSTDLTLSSSFTTGYADEAFVNATYGINILNNSFSGDSFEAELLFDSVIEDEETLSNISINATGGEALTTEYVEGSMNNGALGNKTTATFIVSGLDPFATYTNWTVKGLSPSYLTPGTRSIYDEADMIETPVSLNQYLISPGDIIVDEDGNITLDINHDGEGDLTVITDDSGNNGFDINGDGTVDIIIETDTDGNISNIDLPSISGIIDIDGDASKDDVVVTLPDGSISIIIDGDLSNPDNIISIIPNDDDEDGTTDSFTVNWPDGLWGLPGGEIVINTPTTDGVITIEDKDGNGILTLVPNPGGGFVVLPPTITDGDGNTGLDVDGDGVIDFPFVLTPTPGLDLDGDGIADITTGTAIITTPDGNTGLDVDGDGVIDFPIITDEDGKTGIDVDGDGSIDLPILGSIITDEDGNIIGIDTDGDGEVDINVNTDNDLTDPSLPAGYENEAIVNTEAGMKVDESSITHNSFNVDIQFDGKITDATALEFTEGIQFRYNGTEVESELVAQKSSNTLTYKINASAATTYTATGWEVNMLPADYLTGSTRAISDDQGFEWTAIELSTDVTTPEEPTTSLKWLWILIIIILAISLIGLLIFLVMKVLSREEKEPKVKTESQAKVARIEIENQHRLETMTKTQLMKLATILYDKDSLKGYEKVDLVDLLKDEDIDELLSQLDNPNKAKLESLTKAQLMKLATQVYEKDSLAGYEKTDLVDLILSDSDIKF